MPFYYLACILTNLLTLILRCPASVNVQSLQFQRPPSASVFGDAHDASMTIKSISER